MPFPSFMQKRDLEVFFYLTLSINRKTKNMKKLIYIFAIATLFVRCGETKEEVKAAKVETEKREKEIDESTDDLFDSLEDDTQEAEG